MSKINSDRSRSVNRRMRVNAEHSDVYLRLLLFVSPHGSHSRIDRRRQRLTDDSAFSAGIVGRSVGRDRIGFRELVSPAPPAAIASPSRAPCYHNYYTYYYRFGTRRAAGPGHTAWRAVAVVRTRTRVLYNIYARGDRLHVKKSRGRYRRPSAGRDGAARCKTAPA